MIKISDIPKKVEVGLKQYHDKVPLYIPSNQPGRPGRFNYSIIYKTIDLGNPLFLIRDNGFIGGDFYNSGTVLVEAGFYASFKREKYYEPGCHWSDNNYLSTILLKKVIKKRLFEPYLGFQKNELIKIESDEHFLELQLKYL